MTDAMTGAEVVDKVKVKVKVGVPVVTHGPFHPRAVPPTMDPEVVRPRGTSPKPNQPASDSANPFIFRFQDADNLPALVQSLTDSGPVGGCLTKYLSTWKKIGADEWSLRVLERGYAPNFSFILDDLDKGKPHRHRPPLTRDWRRNESANNPRKAAMLQQSVDEMLEKHAIELVKDKNSLGFYSHVFLVIKKNGKFRPVINLKALNQTLEVPTFKMETVASVSAAISPGDLAISLDLTDGYFHVPIARWFRKYLRFVINGKVYQFKALPFGLATAPRVFTKILCPLASFLHVLGVPFHRFLDDFLCRSNSRKQLLRWAVITITVICGMGFHINIPKSMLEPTQDFIYIGVRFLTELGLMTPPDDRIEKILKMIPILIDEDPAPAKLWLSLIGLMGSAERQIPLARLYLRPLQICLHSQFHLPADDLETRVALNGKVRAALEWWMDISHLTKGQPLGLFSPDLAIYTDASMTSWGAHTDNASVNMTFSGVWSQEEKNRSINQLELLSVIRTVQELPPECSGMRILIASDNTSTVAYINKLGGTRSIPMWELTLQLFLLAQSRNITLRARHIPGRLNRLADMLSRSGQVVNTEWILNRKIFLSVIELWGSPSLDLMATAMTTQMRVYVSPVPDPFALAVDAMSFPWTGLDVYCFPPWPVIAPLLQKLKHSQCIMTIVVPRWPNRPWFPDLLDLLIESPRRLPVFIDLLSQPHNRLQHGNVESLSLHACRLSSTSHLVRDFRRTCPFASLGDEEAMLQADSTTRSGSGSPFGVVGGRLIQSWPLQQI